MLSCSRLSSGIFVCPILLGNRIVVLGLNRIRPSRVTAWLMIGSKGWFESVYLDHNLRVTRDVRGDVTVLVKDQE